MYEIYINKILLFDEFFDDLMNVTLSFKKWKRKVYKISVIVTPYITLISYTWNYLYQNENLGTKIFFQMQKQVLLSLKIKKHIHPIYYFVSKFTNGEQELYLFIHLSIIIILKIIYLHSQTNVLNFL